MLQSLQRIALSTYDTQSLQRIALVSNTLLMLQSLQRIALSISDTQSLQRIALVSDISKRDCLPRTRLGSRRCCEGTVIPPWD